MTKMKQRFTVGRLKPGGGSIRLPCLIRVAEFLRSVPQLHPYVGQARICVNRRPVCGESPCPVTAVTGVITSSN
jgi:hypothetical protein